MNEKSPKNNLHQSKSPSDENDNFPGYPVYPANEDIFGNAVEETDIDPENITKAKKSAKILDFDITNGINYKDNAPGSDLDVPGSELDDDQEDVGSEDEENNYYSLGEDDPDEDYDDILFTNKQ